LPINILPSPSGNAEKSSRFMTQQYKDRNKIQEDHEIDELYGLPRFDLDEQAYYFALTQEERDLANTHRVPENRVLFILQAGYFKAKTMFFSFEFSEVQDDIRQILRQHFPLSAEINMAEPVLRQTKHAQQQKFLALYGHRACNAAERADLMEKARHVVKISAKPIYLFQALIHYLETQRIVVPGYSFLQDVVSQTLAAERERITEIIERSLDDKTRAVLDGLYVSREGIYAITALKHEPKDFSLKEMKSEIARCRSVATLYQTTHDLLPALGISNDSVAYYAALVDYYTVQKLQQMPTGMVYLYLLCFILHRYHTLNDNLINAVIFHVRKVIDAAKAAAKEKILGRQLEANESICHVSQILGLFLDESIADDVAFSEVKKRAFAILERDKFTQVSQFLKSQSFADGVFEWEFIAAFAPAFKQHLRPLLTQLTFAGHRSDDGLIEAITFLKTSFEKGKSLSRYRFDQIPQAFIPQGMKVYIYEEDEQGQKRIHPDKYEFLVYRLLRNYLEAGDIYVSDSRRFRSFEDDLIPLKTWQAGKEKILKEIDVPDLAKPMTVLLAELETELEAKYVEVNRRILSGENAHIKLTKRRGEITWSLPYVRDENVVNNPFFDSLQQINIAHLLQFVDSRCQCLEAFTHILNRYVKTPMDKQAITACLVAYGTNVGLGKMGEISDLNYQTLFAAANSFLRLDTLRESNDRVSNAMAKLPIFRHYDIDDTIHSSSDGQKFETQFSTIGARHSPKYFGLKKGVSQYTMVANHVPVNVRIFGANDHESHYVFDVLYNNTTDIQPTIHSTDTHGANQVNFAILSPFGYQFAPRYKDIRDKTNTLYGFKNPGDYDEKFLLKPTSKANTSLIIEEEDNIQHIFASLALKVTTQSVIIGKLSAYARKNHTKKALWELDNIRRSSYLLTYVDSLAMRRNVQRALNRGESYHKLRRAVAYAYSGRLRVKTELEQQIWAECSRLLANCVIYYNACILSELLERAERRGDHEQADQIKRVSPVSWKHVNFYGQYDFLEAAGAIDLSAIVDWLEEVNGGGKTAN
jgi:TnpA family transposase